MAMELSGDHPSQRTGVNSSSRTPDAPSISSKSPPNFQEEYIPPEGFSAVGSIDIGGQRYTASQEKPPSMHQLLQIKEANDQDRAERNRKEQEEMEHASGWQRVFQLAKRPVLALGVLALLASCIPAPGAHGSQHILPTGTHLTPDIGAHLSPIPVIPSYTPGIPPHISGELDGGQHISAISTPVPGEKNPPPPMPPTYSAPKDSGSDIGASPTPGIEATATPTPGIEATATPVPTETMIPAPSETPTPEASATPSYTAPPTETPNPGPTIKLSPTETPEPTEVVYPPAQINDASTGHNGAIEIKNYKTKVDEYMNSHKGEFPPDLIPADFDFLGDNPKTKKVEESAYGYIAQGKGNFIKAMSPDQAKMCMEKAFWPVLDGWNNTIWWTLEENTAWHFHRYYDMTDAKNWKFLECEWEKGGIDKQLRKEILKFDPNLPNLVPDPSS